MKLLTARKITRGLTSLIIGLPLVFTHLASAETYVPAQFGNTLSYIEQTVAMPELTASQPVVAVYCQADVDADGITSDVVCFEKEGFDQVRDQTAEAVSGRQFTPAQVDGKKIPVRMQFRVIYANLDGQPPIMLLPNLGYMQNKYGHDYTDPQERLDQPQWYELYKRNDWAEGLPFFSREENMTRVLAMIDENGKVISARRLEAQKANKRDAIEVEKSVKRASFIPGFSRGKAERMQYVAVLHYLAE